MSRRTALVAVALVAVIGAAVGIIRGSGDGPGERENPPNPPARAIALDVDSSGRVFALVERLEGGQWRPAIARVEDDGSLGAPSAGVPLDDAEAIAVESDAALLVAGSRMVDGRRQLAVARFSPSGRPDSRFGTNGVVTVRAGDGDAVPRGVAFASASGIVVAGDATDGDRHALAVARIDPDTGRSAVELIGDAAAGGATPADDGAVLVAGTDTRDGSAVLARIGNDGPADVTRARTRLTSASWRAVATRPGAGAVVVGSGRDRDARSLVAVQRFGAGDDASPGQAVAVGEGDAYGAAVRIDREGRVVVGANGVQGDGPAAYVVTFPAGGGAAGTRDLRAAGRVAGITPDGGVLTTRWDGERQKAKFTP